MKLKKLLVFCMGLLMSHAFIVAASTHVAIKYPGKKSTEFVLLKGTDGRLVNDKDLPLTIDRKVESKGDVTNITLNITAKETCWFNLTDTIDTGMKIKYEK